MTSNNHQRNYPESKRNLDKVFLATIHCLDIIKDCGSTSEHLSELYVMSAWSSLYMNVSWLQRIYHKAQLDDSEQYDIGSDADEDRNEKLKRVIGNLNWILECIEDNGFSILWEEIDKPIPFQLMIDNVYSGTYEAMSLLENELNLNKTIDNEQS